MQALIVDDSRTACRVLGRLLERYEIGAESVPDAEAALERLRHHKPDVIFMDHAMPGMDGLETVRLLKGNPDTATIPVIMYTSREGEVYLGQARALGALDVLPKGQLEERLEDAVQRVRRIRRRQRAEPEAPAPSAASSAETMSDGAQAELTRQMYLILTEQQISQKNSAARISRSVERSIADRLEALATRLEAASELRTEALEGRMRRRDRRRLSALSVAALLLAVAASVFTTALLHEPGAPATAQAADAGDAVAVARELREAVAALRAATLRNDQPTLPAGRLGQPAAGLSAVGSDGTPVGWIVGRAVEGSHYDAVSEFGFLFGISADGSVGWPMPTRYFTAPGCNGEPMVRDLPGVVFRDDDAGLWHTPLAEPGERMRPLSVMDTEGDCVEINGDPMTLRRVTRNDPAVTGLRTANEPVRLSPR